MVYNDICIVGLGYVGLPLAIEFSKKNKVVGFDINKQRINELKKGIDSTNEASDFSNNENILFTSNEEDIKNCHKYIVTVPTPIDNNKKPNLNPLISASKTIGKYLDKLDLVVYESTVYPSCTEDVCIPILEESSGLDVSNSEFFVGYSPERINPGDKVNTLTTIEKVVSGYNQQALALVELLYKSINIKTYSAPNIKVAEMSKAIENAQRDLNISFMNELAIYCNLIGINTNDVLNAANTKWNFLPFTAGLVGGHCISVDPYYLIHKAESLGLYLDVIASGRRVNDRMPKFIVSNLIKEMIRKKLELKGSRILIMGITFKENVPDIRNSKVIDVINELKEYNLIVDVYDPYVDTSYIYNEHNILCIDSEKDLKYLKFDAIIYCVDHDKFKSFDYLNYLKPNSVVYDLKNKLPKDIVNISL